ncbi:MAG: fructosamine kinase family protein [Gallionella sp.]
MPVWDSVASAISDATQCPFAVSRTSSVGGGSINEAYRLDGIDGTRYFVKLNDARRLAMFVAEIEGLKAIASTHTIHVPSPVTYGKFGGKSFLVLQHLEFGLHGDAKLFGEQLAALHRCVGKDFGFNHDNFIGTTPQPNGWKESWIEFWREHRLGFQLRLAAENGYGGELQRLGEKLIAVLPAFFDRYIPQPSLLHGDLWGGNHTYLKDGTPTIFDPAAYYGDRECDLAMTELFGGYAGDFYAAYRNAYPLDEGYAVRKNLYNLYHIINHANLFGGGYARQAEGMMQRLLADV